MQNRPPVTQPARADTLSVNSRKERARGIFIPGLWVIEYRWLAHSPMLRFAVKKLLQGVLMILAVSIITFTLLSAAGGDAFTNLRNNPQVSEKTIEDLRRVYGLDRPFLVRYGSWLGSAVTGEFGESFSFKVPVGTIVRSRFFNTLMMGLGALALGVGVSFLLAVLSARYQNRFFRWVIDVSILLTASTPRIVLALIALVISLRFSVAAPEAGQLSTFTLVAGGIVLAVPLISMFLAQLHDGINDALQQDFVRLARAKGLSEWRVIIKHASRVAIDPFLALFGLSLGALLAGSVIVETVLGWPGIGALMVSAVRGRDVPLVMGIVFVASAAVWAGNTIAEMLQMMNDPRVRP
jgi:peptide/nickel transport system permease protein